MSKPNVVVIFDLDIANTPPSVGSELESLFSGRGHRYAPPNPAVQGDPNGWIDRALSRHAKIDAIVACTSTTLPSPRANIVHFDKQLPDDRLWTQLQIAMQAQVAMSANGGRLVLTSGPYVANAPAEAMASGALEAYATCCRSHFEQSKRIRMIVMQLSDNHRFSNREVAGQYLKVIEKWWPEPLVPVR